MSINYKIVSIEGNIGSGKSTLLENLRNYYKNNKNVIFLREPVEEWDKIKDNEGNTMLKKFYADQEKYSFAFQMMAYISRLKILRDTVKEINDEKRTLLQQRFDKLINIPLNKKQEHIDKFTFPEYVIITERSLYTDKHVFAKMLYDQGKIEDVCYQIYLNWFEEFTSDFPINYSVYVNAEPEKCYERVHIRARVGEELIPLSYLQNCHTYHEDFLANTDNKLVLDGNINIYENEKIVEHWIEQINTFLYL